MDGKSVQIEALADEDMQELDEAEGADEGAGGHTYTSAEVATNASILAGALHRFGHDLDADRLHRGSPPSAKADARTARANVRYDRVVDVQPRPRNGKTWDQLVQPG